MNAFLLNYPNLEQNDPLIQLASRVARELLEDVLNPTEEKNDE